MSNATRTNGRGQGEVWKGLVAGLIGGLVASWTMDRFQDVWISLSENDDDEQQMTSDKKEQDDTTVKAASAISEGFFDHQLTKEEREIAGAGVHYALGTGVGGLYGAVAEVVPVVTSGAGLPFGVAFWLVVDETAVPLLRLSNPPTDYPVATHVYALASHLVYGLTAEVIRRSLRKALS